MVKSQRAVLLGPNQQENLALQYLASAAVEAGHEAMLVGYNDRRDLDGAVAAALSHAPDIIGIGIPFQYCIGDALLLAKTLRERGFQGHLTCGGHVPTFCYAELLRDAPFDSVVRHEGEDSFVEMLDALGRGETVAGIAGLVWRKAEGEGIETGPCRPPSRDIDRLPWPRRGDAPYIVAGVPVAFILTARGCTGECHYCSIKAFSRSAGGPPFRMRTPESVADEVAFLYHERDARIFFVQDDLFVLMNESATLKRVEAMRVACQARGVADAAWWVKGRPETITPAVVDAMKELGVLHVFIGLENASEERLIYLGRTHKPKHNRRAIDVCAERGMLVSFNFMIFDPDCSVDDVEITLDFADECVGMPWNLCRTEVYSGTGLLEKLKLEERLLGDYRSYGYIMRDHRAELMFRILRVALHERAFAFDALMNRLISLSFGRQVHQRFFPGPGTDLLAAEVKELMSIVHRDTIGICREALAYVRRADLGDHAGARKFAVDLAFAAGERDLPWHRQAVRAWERANARGMTMLGHIDRVQAPQFNQVLSFS